MKSVAIIGGGPAGLAMGSFLAKYDFAVTVFEKVQTPGPVGAGIMLQRSGMRVLSELGLLDTIRGLGEEIHYFKGYNKKGKEVLSLNLSSKNRVNDFGLGIQRGALFEALSNAANNHQVKFSYGSEIKSIVGDVGRKIVIDQNGIEYGPYEIIIVANGARSKLRNDFSITKFDQPQKWGAVWSLLDVVDQKYNASILHNYKGTAQMLGFMSIGRLTKEAPKKINFFWSIKMSEKDKWLNQSEEEWKSEILRLAPEHKDILSGLKKDNCIIAPYHDAFLSPQYQNGVFFIGDAAHAMSPQLSAGTNLSLLDAWLLSLELAKSDDLDKVAKEFYRLRKSQLKYYYKVSKLVTPLFQSDYKLAWVRNNFMGTLLKIPGPKQIFRDTLLGRRKSLFRNINKKWTI